jgi:glucokinase
MKNMHAISSYPGLIADIGATNARFALCDQSSCIEERVLKCADYPSPVEAAKAYMEQVGCVAAKAGAFAIAGPVTGDRFQMTNHAWDFSIAETRAALGLTHLTLMNDFKAIALAVPHLKPEHLRRVGGSQASQPGGTIGIIGPGTGLGVASLVWGGQSYIPVPGEGGHVTMAAKTRREFDVFETLYEKYHHISAERVCSGKGLVNIYNALRTLEQRDDLPDLTPEQISAAAVQKSCPLCMEALDLMIGFLGRVAGDLALTLGAGGGIYLAGGICTQLGDFFLTSHFREEFDAKGRFGDYLKKIPTYLILHPFVAFIGLRSDVARNL